DGDGETLTVLGLDIADDEVLRAYGVERQRHRGAKAALELADPFLLVSQPDGIVLTRSFAARRGLAVGDRIALTTPEGVRDFIVRGLLEPGGLARVLGANLAVQDVYAAETSFTRPGFVNRVDVVVRPDRDPTAVAEAIAAALPPSLRV